MVHPRFKPGDHLWKKGGRLGGKLYDHHLIYKGDGSCGFHVVIENSFRAGGVVQKTLPDEKLSSFVLYERPADAEVCLARAEAALGESYSLLFFNCETFANQCVRGVGRSRQVHRATGHLALSIATAGGAATTLSVGLVTTQTVPVSVPADGFWGRLGFKSTVLKTVVTTHPLGIAAAAGAGCSCCLWGCFAAFGSDPRKKTCRAEAAQTCPTPAN
eukprot:TRINITY_DN33846_c0_g1_i2.p1 TRINITY_DN33846_c0_g1~~TRINITY_DN33846_c0_g1_i2.p1  ORF type:complete len:216 (+),score=35.91 TRINITY_DN33846_c0_g1_i2:3-650(+)